MISQAAIEKEVAKRGARAAGIHYRRSYNRAYGKLQRAKLYSPTDVEDHARLKSTMYDSTVAMQYIASTYLKENNDVS